MFGVQRDASGATGQVDDPLPGTVEVLLRRGQLAGAALAAGATALSLRRREGRPPSTERLLRRLAAGRCRRGGGPATRAPRRPGRGRRRAAALSHRLLRAPVDRAHCRRAADLPLAVVPRPASALAGARTCWSPGWSRGRCSGTPRARDRWSSARLSVHVAAALLWAGSVAALVPAGVSHGGPDARDRLRAAGARRGADRRPQLGRRRHHGGRPGRGSVPPSTRSCSPPTAGCSYSKIGLVCRRPGGGRRAVRRSLGAGVVREQCSAPRRSPAGRLGCRGCRSEPATCPRDASGPPAPRSSRSPRPRLTTRPDATCSPNFRGRNSRGLTRSDPPGRPRRDPAGPASRSSVPVRE